MEAKESVSLVEVERSLRVRWGAIWFARLLLTVLAIGLLLLLCRSSPLVVHGVVVAPLKGTASRGVAWAYGIAFVLALLSWCARPGGDDDYPEDQSEGGRVV